MDPNNKSCPVCTLYLRPGITLKNHLSSHPKQKVIEALVRLSQTNDVEKIGNSSGDFDGSSIASSAIVNQTWNQGNMVMPQMPGNHVFIYQQSMSSTSGPQPNLLNVNASPSQQYVIPTILNPQMMPYIYQQQVIMSGSCLNQMRALPFDLPSISQETTQTIDSSSETDESKVEEIEEKSEDILLITETTVKKAEDLDDSGLVYDETDEIVLEEEIPKDDLSKDCQTQTITQLSPESAIQEDIESEKPNTDYYFINEGDNQVYTPGNIDPSSLFTTSNLIQPDRFDFVEVDGMQVVINDINEFSTNQIISQVENFDGVPDRPGVLMTIGGMMGSSKDEFHDESESSNVNIRADERMPPRGELSGQESIGGSSDTTWNRVNFNEGSSEMFTSYNSITRENWEASDSSDVEVPPLQSRIPPQVDYQETENVTVTFAESTVTYKCTSCDVEFSSLREKRNHEIEIHKRKINRIGSDVGKSKIKKIIVKFKSDRQENSDNVFTNKLKLENNETEKVQEMVDDPTNIVKTDENLEMKTVCPLCNCVLVSARALREHKISVHNVTAQTRHKCATCEEQFPNDYKFSEHLRIHPLECQICGKLFYRRQNIQLHMRRHLGIKPYKCDVCNKSFLTKQKLDEHRNIHTGEAPIKCSLCEETFRRHSNLVQHRNRHHLNLKKKVKDYICVCKEVFHSKKKFAWHKEIHDAKPKACTQCNEKFIHMSSLTRHMRRAHNDRFLPNGHKHSENVECPICKGVFLKSSLEVHIRNHSGQRPFACLICNKDFTTKWNLKLHKWTHASRVAKPFKCELCKGAFIRESDYIAHMNSHKSIRPYTCNHCGAQFIRKYNCQRHVKEHENEKMFNCKVCGKSFHRSYYLKDHMRIHSGTRPYSCHICGKTSTTKSNHNKHVQIHHAREPVSTEN